MDGQKNTVVAIIRENENHKEQLQQVEQEVEQEVEMRNKTYNQQAMSGEEENIIAKTIAEFRRKKLNDTQIAETGQANEITNITEDPPYLNIIAEDPSNSNYNTIYAVQNSITTPQESHTNNSQLSVALYPSLAKRQNKNKNPACSAANISFSTDTSLLSTTRSI